MVETSLAPLVARYASLRHVRTDHHAASPLGAWLLLALAVPAPDPEVETALGTDVFTAHRLARAFLETSPDVARTALALWVDPSERTPALEVWEEGLPQRTRGPVPTQEAADDWARRATGGLIDAFPLVVTQETTLVMATALAVKEAWTTPFRTRQGPLAAHWGVSHSLVTHRGGQLLDSPLGVVGALVARTPGMAVLSVVADEEHRPHDVLAAAHALALDPSLGSSRHKAALRLDDAPREGHSWRVSAGEVLSHDASPVERSVTGLVAWKAQTREDLELPQQGLVRAGNALGRLLASGSEGVRAVQATTASYGTFGFEAAAVTALSMRAGSAPARTKAPCLTLELEFRRPHAVVAVLDDPAGAHHGVPLFSAWVSEAVEPDVEC